MFHSATMSSKQLPAKTPKKTNGAAAPAQSSNTENARDQPWRANRFLVHGRNTSGQMSPELRADIQERFIQALAKNGGVFVRAAAAVDVGWNTLYYWRKTDEEFAEAWQAAIEVGTDVLEDEAVRRGMEGIDEPLTHQGQFTYTTDEKGVRHQNTIKKYSDTLLIVALKMRGRLVERSEVSGPGGQPVLHAVEHHIVHPKGVTVEGEKG